MIQCKECGFAVNEMMRFALMKNICPSCGSGLLSGKDADVISVIQSKLASQRFSGSLTENQVYDISLFFFNELKHGLGDLAIDLKSSAKRVKVLPSSDEGEDDDPSYKEGDTDEDELRSIRESVAAEILGDREDEEESDEDIHSKAERLRRLHQQRITTSTPSKNFKQGKFKGVSRTT